MDGHYKIRKASKKDAETILFFINRLADYEKLSDKVNATTDLLIKYGFSDRPFFEALIAKDEQDAPLGLALYFFTFSTFLAKPTLYLEDLFVLPEYRGLGIGKRFFRELVGIAQDYGCGRMEWSVLDWNSPSIEFYKALGAEPVSGWTTYRLDEQALASFDNI